MVDSKGTGRPDYSQIVGGTGGITSTVASQIIAVISGTQDVRLIVPQTSTTPISFPSTSSIVVSGTVSSNIIAITAGTQDVRLIVPQTGTVPVSGTIQSDIFTTTVAFPDSRSNSVNLRTTAAGAAINSSDFLFVFNNNSWDRLRTVTSTQISGVGILAVGDLGQVPSGSWGPLAANASTQLIAQTTSTAATANLTSTVVNVSTSASTLLASNTGRLYASFRNAFTGTIYIGYNAIPTTTNFSNFLLPGDFLEFNQTNLFLGTFNAISTTTTSSVAVASW